MSKVYRRNFLFSNIDKIVYCAEEQVQYGEEKVTPFYYNTEKQVKLFYGDSLMLPRI